MPRFSNLSCAVLVSEISVSSSPQVPHRGIFLYSKVAFRAIQSCAYSASPSLSRGFEAQRLDGGLDQGIQLSRHRGHCHARLCSALSLDHMCSVQKKAAQRGTTGLDAPSPIAVGGSDCYRYMHVLHRHLSKYRAILFTAASVCVLGHDTLPCTLQRHCLERDDPDRCEAAITHLISDRASCRVLLHRRCPR